MKRLSYGLVSLMLGCGIAAAQPVDGRTAARMLFSTDRIAVEVVRAGGLSDQELGFVAEAAKQQTYYAAIAISPTEGLMSEATVAATNYHSTSAAEEAARTACTARQAEAEEEVPPCVIVARVRPRGWEPRALSLNQQASDIVRREYRRADTPKALAASASTVAWAFKSGPNAAQAALDACNTNENAVEAQDCTLAIVD